MIKAKKSLGQNFLIDNNIINKILNVTDIRNKDILEIGPGTGNLTAEILKKSPKRLLVIEKDEELVNILKNNFNNAIEIINNDVLDIDENLLSKTKLTVFGNLPYNISTEILCKWILNIKKNFWFEYLILMFQKEVADRIIAKFNTKNYGRLSILANWTLEIKKICDVKPGSFLPAPKVDSSILFFKPKKKIFKFKSPKNLEMITRVFFMHRRKKIKKAFSQLFGENTKIATKLEIDLNLRPQNLDFDTYFEIVNEYEKLRG